MEIGLVQFSPLHFALTALYPFLFVPLTLGLSILFPFPLPVSVLQHLPLLPPTSHTPRPLSHPPLAAPSVVAPVILALLCDQNAVEAHFARHDGTPLLMKLLMPSIPSSVSHASASRSAV